MKTLKYSLLLLICCLVATTTKADVNKLKHTVPGTSHPAATFRDGDCAQGKSQVDMNVNNVRARLLSSGDVWWDLDRGKYVVPKVDPASGIREVSSIFAGAVWMGGIVDGNLKAACQTYRSSTANDFWPGPLNPAEGTIDDVTCKDWDKHFVVSGDSIRVHIQRWNLAKASGATYTADQIPADVKGWPARGNPYFYEINGFELPNTDQGLASFFDANGNNLYEPQDGDYPTIEVRYCPNNQYPDQMIFWIYNDAGGIHTNTKADAIGMEVQVQAFAYKTNDELNDMTFQRYKLINRATQPIDSTYFAMWVDPDLGCHTDDYIGCDTTVVKTVKAGNVVYESRNLAFVYNEDAYDGTPVGSCVCDGDVASYCDKIPVLGIDYFRGPRRPVYDSTGLIVIKDYTGTEDSATELGMSSFTYYNNAGVGNPLPGTTDPDTKEEYYNYITGRWKDGTPFSFGGSGYNGTGAQEIKYAFTGNPANQSDWSMCSVPNLGNGDRRTIQATGPFRLLPGAVNELIIGAVWIPDQGACPDISALTTADDKAQALFDNCFDIVDGPDAPDVCAIELDREVILLLSNDTSLFATNNPYEKYQENVLGVTEGDTTYKFEGYKIFQFSGPNVSINDINNTDKARLVAQVDVKNNISTIYNWSFIKNPVTNESIWIPTAKVEGTDAGIKHAFNVTEDRFAKTDKRLVNHKKYYFVAIAYAHNNWKQLNTTDGTGQQAAYIEGRRNIGDRNTGNVYYTVIPRPITDKSLNALYGEGVEITRIDGVGVSDNAVDMTTETKDAIMNGTFDGRIKYQAGEGPINIRIFNPLDVVDGDFEISMKGDLVPSQYNPNILAKSTHWELKDVNTGEVLISEKTIESLNEQLLGKYGFSVSIAQVADTGEEGAINNGALGSEVVYSDPNKSWLTAITDKIGNFNSTDFIRTANLEADAALDPGAYLSKMSTLFVPYLLCRHDVVAPSQVLFSPAWKDAQNLSSVRSDANKLNKLNNVDIILTPDKSKWSRCMIVETTAPFFYESNGLGLETVANPDNTNDRSKNMDLRKSYSVGKDAGANGLPIEDGAVEPAMIPNGLGGMIPNPKAGTKMNGMGWFPGYAIDVETGERLNIFFGESSVIDPALGGTFQDDNGNLGRDMMWNPSGQPFLQDNDIDPTFNYNQIWGGQHYIYVTRSKYDSCSFLRTRMDPKFNPSSLRKISALQQVTWTCFPLLTQNSKLLSYGEGVIPTETTIKLRVNNPYKFDADKTGTGENENYPKYQFSLKGLQASAVPTTGVNAQLAQVNVVPNPYYGYSSYETSQFTNIVKITNLPAKCNVTIYTIDGKFIRQYKRDEIPMQKGGLKPTEYKQITPDLEWDMKNDKGIPISSGVYLIHVDAEGLGERTLKWFGVNRQFDPQGL